MLEKHFFLSFVRAIVRFSFYFHISVLTFFQENIMNNFLPIISTNKVTLTNALKTELTQSNGINNGKNLLALYMLSDLNLWNLSFKTSNKEESLLI